MPKFDHAVVEFLSTLLYAREQTHIFHWQNTGPGSFARHKALGKFYEAIPGLADRYAEAYIGKYGPLTDFSRDGEFFNGDKQVMSFYTELEKMVGESASDLPKDPDLVNIHADVLEALHHLLFKLKRLA